MAENSLIAWTQNTFNPWIGCVKVSDGCKNCYAETLVVNRMGRPGLWGPAKTTQRQRTSPANWQRVRRWNVEARKAGVAMRVFCASLADVFEDHPDTNKARPDLFELWRTTPFLHWQVLTKRPENMRWMLPADWGDNGFPNVWLGTSIENMKVAERADDLNEIPAVVRFISYEPALGPLDDLDLRGIHWVIYGGESGPNFRPHDLAWPRAMRAKCAAERVAFFYKQSSAPRTEMGIQLDGEIVRNYPVPRSTREPDRWKLSREERQAYSRRRELDESTASTPPSDPRAAASADLPLFGEES
jgi:protein gp37